MASIQSPTLKKYLRELGRMGGKAKSKAKASAARENGKLGGRPRTKKRGEKQNG